MLWYDAIWRSSAWAGFAAPEIQPWGLRMKYWQEFLEWALFASRIIALHLHRTVHQENKAWCRLHEAQDTKNKTLSTRGMLKRQRIFSYVVADLDVSRRFCEAIPLVVWLVMQRLHIPAVAGSSIAWAIRAFLSYFVHGDNHDTAERPRTRTRVLVHNPADPESDISL